MIKLLRYVGLIVGLFALLIMGVSAQEATDGAITILVLEDGSAIEGVFNAEVNTHLYAFNATAGDTVTISMTQPEDSQLDPFLVLLGSAGQVIAVDDDGGTEVALSALITTEIPEDGTYYLLASSFVFIDGILMQDLEIVEETYTLKAEGMTTPLVDGKPQERLRIFYGQLAYGVSAPGYSKPEEPVYFWVFDGSAGDIVTINIETDGFTPLLYLMNPVGERIAISLVDVEAEDLTTIAIKDVELPEDGQYLILATDIFFYETVDYTTENEAELSYTGGEFTIILEKSN